MSKPKRTREELTETFLRRASSTSVSVSSEAISIPAGAAGAVVNFKFTYAPIADSNGVDLSSKSDTSIALTSTAFINQVEPKNDAELANGDWFVDPLTGEARGKKADTSTSGTANYSYFTILIRAAGSAGTTPSTTTLGMANTVPFAIFRSSPVVRTNGQLGPLEAGQLGDLLASLATRLAGEDITNDVQKSRYSGSSTYISSATTTVCKGGAGHLGKLTVQGGTAGTIIGYDNTAASGSLLFSFDSTNALAPYVFDIVFGTGLTIVTSAATKLTVSWN